MEPKVQRLGSDADVTLGMLKKDLTPSNYNYKTWTKNRWRQIRGGGGGATASATPEEEEKTSQLRTNHEIHW